VGLASPVVAGGRVFYFDNTGGKETLHAMEAATQKEIWRHEVDDPFTDTQGPTGPRCTPLVDGDRVYAQSCRGELQCLETATGRLVWRANYVRDFGAVFIGEKGNAPGASRHGNNGSPIVAGDRLYANVGGTNGAGVVCFEKRTGRVIWKSQDDQAGYAPPALAELGGVRQVLSFTAEGLIGLRETNGELLWRVPMKTAFARHVTTPVWLGDVAVVGSHQAGLIGTRVRREGEGLRAEQAWLSKEAAMNFASPVLVGTHLYGVGPNRDVVCVEVSSGRLAWSKPGLFRTSADRAHGGLLVFGDRILMLTDSGELILFRARPESYEELGRAQVCGVNWCNPAYAAGRLYVRDGLKGPGELVCVELATE
jgi:outer membrane protein assembly factor BamB